MNSTEENSQASITVDEMLDAAVNKSLKRLNAEVDSLVDIAMQRTDDSVHQVLVSAGLVSGAPIKKAASISLQRRESRFFSLLSEELRNFFMRPTGAVAAIALVSMGTVIYYQQQNITEVREAVAEVSTERSRQRESSQIFATLPLTFFTKIYTDSGDTLIGRAKNQAKELDLEIKVVAVPETGYELMGVELQPGQRVLIVGGLIAKSEQQQTIKKLLEAPDDSEGTVAIILVEY